MKTYLKSIFILYIAVAITSCSKDNDDQVDENAEIDTTENSTESEILRLVNEHRVSIQLPALEVSTLATTLAKEHTIYMIDKKRISHDNFDKRFDRLKAEENARTAAENVASFQPTAEKVVNAWLDSDGHRQNIEGNFSFTGIAALKDDQGRFYYTQIFHN
ncbi:CAP domain-containing protein [Aquimarina sp. W85]|uniref:CAP domain-containing protein n=1 Tax=Aquimarina rhodophyticola TaxID=3342246 RepID=UPI0036711A2E